MSKTFWDIIDETFEKVREPLSAKEIWVKANELNITEGFETTGKTPWATIGAYLYTSINSSAENSKYVQISERPAKFILRELEHKIDFKKVEKKQEIEEKKIEKTQKWDERDLHPLLVTYANTNTHFKAFLKTIFHEKSKKGKVGLNEWLHPDLVGVFFPYKEFTKETLDIQKQLAITSIKLFSFEMKINLTFANLRKYFFQAVSNSSWANEGYLVTLKLEEDPMLLDEIRRLNNAFGIGLIKLNSNNVFESEILFPAKERADIDWDTANRLAKENEDFRNFLEDIAEDTKLGKIKSDYDKIFKPEEIEKYIKQKNIY